MLKSYLHQINIVYGTCIQSYKDACKYVNKHKNGEITGHLISMTTRRKLYKEIMVLLSQMYKIQKIDITKFLKLKKLHVYQLKRLENKSFKKNRLYFAQVESLFRKTNPTLPL